MPASYLFIYFNRLIVTHKNHLDENVILTDTDMPNSVNWVTKKLPPVSSRGPTQ